MDQTDSQLLIAQSAALCNLMGSDKRLLILDILTRGEISVTPLGVLVGLSQSALSQQLFKLRSAGLVSSRREGNMIFYWCDAASVSRVLCLLREIFDDAV